MAFRWTSTTQNDKNGSKDKNVDNNGSIIIGLDDIPANVKNRPNFCIRDYINNPQRYREIRNEAYSKVRKDLGLTAKPNQQNKRSNRKNQTRTTNRQRNENVPTYIRQIKSVEIESSDSENEIRMSGSYFEHDFGNLGSNEWELNL